jgi:hypothetical protein
LALEWQRCSSRCQDHGFDTLFRVSARTGCDRGRLENQDLIDTLFLKIRSWGYRYSV